MAIYLAIYKYKMRLLITLFILISISKVNSTFAQCNLRFTGKITDEDTKELLQKANIFIKGINVTTETNDKGAFKIEGLCPGHYDIVISHVGCKTIYTHIHIKDDFFQEYLLPHASNQLKEVKVSSTVSTIKTNDEIKGRNLEATKGLSLAESLKRIAGVSVIQTGTNIYKPVIHGLHSNRVIILNNGIRQEGQQWGSEHAPEIDPFVANRIAVVKGAATMRYGGDAIGGIVLVEPKLLRAIPGVGGELNLGLFSNNRMGVMSGIVESNSKKIPALSWRVQGTVKKGGNAKTTNYWLDNSGLEEYNFSLAMGYKKQNWATDIFYSQFNTKLAIFSGSHIGNTTDLIQAINGNEPPDYIRNVGFTYKIDRPYQQVQHHLLKAKTYFNTGKIGRLNIINSFQYNNRKEYDKKRFQSSDNSPQLDLSIATVATDVVWDHYTINNFRGTIGVNGAFQDNQYSERLFIPNYQAINAGVFAIEKWEMNKWIIEGGIRYDVRKFINTNTNGGVNYDDRTYNSFSGNAGIAYLINEKTKVNINTSTAWRAPTINELYSNGLHHGAARIETGSSVLLPERANNVLAGINFDSHKWVIDAAVYIKSIQDFIFLKPTYPPQLTIRGAFPAFEFSQTNARLSGTDISIGYQINHHFLVNTKASILRGWNKTENDWLIQMPADRFDYEIEYSFRNGKFFNESYIKLNLQDVLFQKRVPAKGNIEITDASGIKYLASDYAPPPAAYGLVGLEAGSQIKMGKKYVNVTLSATNLLNKSYRDYLNAFRYFSDDMGRNIALRIKMPFEFGRKTNNNL